MKKSSDESPRWHPGITMHKIPVVGVGGLVFAIGIVVIALVGLPIAKWFLMGALVLGILVVGLLRALRHFHSKNGGSDRESG